METSLFPRAIPALLFLMTIMLLVGCSNDSHDDPGVKVSVNGALQDGSIQTKQTSTGLVVDARAFATKISGLSFYQMLNPPSPGMVLQYGKIISFVSVGFASGFCSLAEVPMEPPLEISGGIYWTPLNFLAEALSGEIEVEAGGSIIAVTTSPPPEIGDIVPQTQTIAQQLEGEFHVRQGEISLVNIAELFTAGYTTDCQAMNAGATYFIVQNPISPRVDLFNRIPFGIQMDQDEAVIWVANTPPECKYFGYQHYLLSRYYYEGKNPGFKKVYARLGDSINNYKPFLNNDPFKKFFVFIITGNQEVHDHVMSAIQEAGITEDLILSLVLPDDVRFGLEMESDLLNFIHRATVFDQGTAKEKYIHNPTLEVLRVTPRKEKATIPMEPPDPRDRQTGIREQDIAGLGALLERLKTNVIAKHGGNFQYIRELKTSTWLYPGNGQAIQEGENVLGETNDTLYLQTDSFVLNDDDLIIVLGVNHDQTGKTVYSNVSCYGTNLSSNGTPVYNGVGGILSTPWTPNTPDRISYFGTAAEYLPDISTAQQDMLYVYKFARRPIDESTFVIPYNLDGSYNGINNGVPVIMGFRMYVDVETTIGPYPGNTEDGNYFSFEGPPGSEVFFDQAILFTNTPPPY
ncbi:MAG: hypothetical protein HN366_01385 [Deltaproteobacteria bacterium]|jgi:hypothetical protein|nr:hypothetical protein [Deltaproteobacteria bacterium]